MSILDRPFESMDISNLFVAYKTVRESLPREVIIVTNS